MKRPRVVTAAAVTLVGVVVAAGLVSSESRSPAVLSRASMDRVISRFTAAVLDRRHGLTVTGELAFRDDRYAALHRCLGL